MLHLGPDTCLDLLHLVYERVNGGVLFVQLFALALSGSCRWPRSAAKLTGLTRFCAFSPSIDCLSANRDNRSSSRTCFDGITRTLNLLLKHVALFAEFLRFNELCNHIVRRSLPRVGQLGHQRRPGIVLLLLQYFSRMKLRQCLFSPFSLFLLLNHQIAKQQQENEDNAEGYFGEGKLEYLVVSLRHACVPVGG